MNFRSGIMARPHPFCGISFAINSDSYRRGTSSNRPGVFTVPWTPMFKSLRFRLLVCCCCCAFVPGLGFLCIDNSSTEEAHSSTSQYWIGAMNVLSLMIIDVNPTYWTIFNHPGIEGFCSNMMWLHHWDRLTLHLIHSYSFKVDSDSSWLNIIETTKKRSFVLRRLTGIKPRGSKLLPRTLRKPNIQVP